ncbi:MAG TPA: DUF5777 family beta-barrel protein [Bacteroidales bacterium]|nr:DUF5777 family beta-barrel protein [Bacteroidales bacterium]
MRKYLLLLCIVYPLLLSAQTGEFKNDSSTESTIYPEETFKSSRVILGQSVENPPNGAIVLLISHHFGALNTGFYDFFGLDQASTRIGLEYGINKFMAVGAGRSTFNKTFDGYLKFQLLRQSKGKRKMPLSVSVFGNMAVNTLKLSNPKQKDYFDARLSYCSELILARNFGNIFSLQIAPTWIHKNLVATPDDHNDIFSVGSGVSFRLSEMFSINGEYHYLIPGQHLTGNTNAFSVSCDIRTAQHVFQLFLTNAQGNFEQAFIAETTGKWSNGYIYFGFNIHRLFLVK